ncbi:MAG: phosphoadenosine phosphosulfate reductase family protein [Syntrophotalea acetylenica]|nr:phosphoadenosine phosphosulfate reductase family protein [Syntrophotalea acetylenica]
MSYPANSENPFLDHLLWVMGANVSPVEIESSQTFAVIGRKQALISPFLKGEFELPGNPKNDLYIVPVSGGADSSALAITMSVLYPHIPFRFVFTDTLAETRDLYENMVAIEKFLGIEITRLIPENGGLYGLIESYGGFLPSMRARWCTRDLKLKPYEAYIEQIREEGRVVHSFVGIRADEPKREGLVSKYPFIKTYFPFQTLGIDRRAVFGILQQTVGVPRLYNHRTRSGCSVCPFQRRSELLGLLRWNPDEFDRGLEYEKLSNRDLLRFDHAAIPLWKDTGISANHQTLPFPSMSMCVPPKHRRPPNGPGRPRSRNPICLAMNRWWICGPARNFLFIPEWEAAVCIGRNW